MKKLLLLLITLTTFTNVSYASFPVDTNKIDAIQVFVEENTEQYHLRMEKQAKKPIQLRIIFILNALMMFLPFLVYFLVTNNKIEMDVVPMHVIYTGIAYIISFGALVYCIVNKKFFAFRTMFFINLLIALPVGVNGGIVVVIVSFILSHTNQVKSFFNSSKWTSRSQFRTFLENY